MKYCPECDSTKDKSEFSKDKSKADGLRRVCKDCDRKRLKIHYRANKNDYYSSTEQNRKKRKSIINSLKEADPCLDCYEYFPYFVMEFDHLMKKDFSISVGITRYSMDAVLKEISKCDLVCTNCHRDRTFGRGPSFDMASLNKTQLKNYKHVYNYKYNNPCEDCLCFFNPHILDFDHLYDKSFNIGDGIYRKGYKILLQEISKCSLVCANCHTFRTQVRRIINRSTRICT